jgi:hypothetical protein
MGRWGQRPSRQGARNTAHRRWVVVLRASHTGLVSRNTYMLRDAIPLDWQILKI